MDQFLLFLEEVADYLTECQTMLTLLQALLQGVLIDAEVSQSSGVLAVALVKNRV